jgi:hypothetical protein
MKPEIELLCDALRRDPLNRLLRLVVTDAWMERGLARHKAHQAAYAIVRREMKIANVQMRERDQEQPAR